jgi:hypothetical protein
MTKFLPLLIPLTLLCTCAGSLYYQNSEFVYHGPRGYKVALIPLEAQFSSDVYAQMDTFYSIVFKDTASGRITAPSYLVASSEKKPALPDQIARKLRSFEIKDHAVHKLSDILDAGETAVVREAAMQPDFLIVPNQFSISSGYSTDGFYNFRCYEFATGKLLYERGNSLQMGGCSSPVCVLQCGFFLLGMAGRNFDDFMKEHTR